MTIPVPRNNPDIKSESVSQTKLVVIEEGGISNTMEGVIFRIEDSKLIHVIHRKFFFKDVVNSEGIYNRIEVTVSTKCGVKAICLFRMLDTHEMQGI